MKVGRARQVGPTANDHRRHDLELMAHLYRRAGFGATREELDLAVAKGYDAVVEELLHPEDQAQADLDLFDRYFPDGRDGRTLLGAQARWLFRMVTTPRSLEEKLTLFWHGLFATGESKLNNPLAISMQLDTFRRCCLGGFRTILLELSKDPAMIIWLDNWANTKDVHNENYGRELLELFSMGVGNYTEDDVKNCARAFTGWTLVNPEVRASHPYGKYRWQFRFRPEQHDYSEKEFLGARGVFDGTDIVDIIMRQPATANFVAKRLYNFFVSDIPDEMAIAELAQVFASSEGEIRTVMRTLLLSEAFRSPRARFAKVQSPTELVVGIARLVGGYDEPSLSWGDLARAPRFMGQDLLNPPSVEGWHTGQEWIDSGLLIERVNFAAAQVSDPSRPGLRRFIDLLCESKVSTAGELVDRCLDFVGPLSVTKPTRTELVRFIESGGRLRWAPAQRADTVSRVTGLLSLAVASREYQFG